MGETFELHRPPQEISPRVLQVEQTLDQQSLSASHTFRHTRLHPANLNMRDPDPPNKIGGWGFWIGLGSSTPPSAR